MTEKTIDTDNQPGLPKRPIRRSQIMSAVEELGIDPIKVTELHIGSDAVEVTAFVYDTNGAKSVLRWGTGYLKHTYSFPIVDDDKLCTTGSVDGSNLEEKQ